MQRGGEANTSEEGTEGEVHIWAAKVMDCVGLWVFFFLLSKKWWET